MTPPLPRARRLAALAPLVLAALTARPAAAQLFNATDARGLVPTEAGRMAAADFNGDGRTDVVFTGLTATNRVLTYVARAGVETVETTPGEPIFRQPFASTTDLVEQVWRGDAATGDFNGDGRPDLVLTGDRAAPGAARPDPISRLYLNQAGALLATSAALPGLFHSRIAVAPGLLALTGTTGSALTTQVFAVASAGTVALRATLAGVEHGALAFGDCDRDGDADLVATGLDAAARPVARLFRNTGTGFAEEPTDLPGVYGGDLAFADVDGDGALDLALTGVTYGPLGLEGVTRLYGSAGCRFTERPLPAEVGSVGGHTVRFADLDRDGTIDLVLSGFAGPFYARNARVYALAGKGSAFALSPSYAGTLFGSAVLLDANGNGLLDLLVLGRTGVGPGVAYYRSTGVAPN